MHNWIIIDDLLVSVNVAGWKYPELNGGPTSWKKTSNQLVEKIQQATFDYRRVYGFLWK